MGLSKAAIIPIASLSAIVGVSILFILWWFPRTWTKGNEDERRIIDAERQTRDAYLARVRAEQQQQQQAAGVNRPEDGSGDGEDGKPPVYVPAAAAGPPPGYRPPVAGLG
ncbi:uncharacterized protein HMPREF1541_05491 [Cyphellophora europaea CBS 101466]|uniref:Uncharacterized protein n=1 Tax=Cyphellophora europaea (strain CBS 101466) TaxID=1220924 RepID=W2RU21_CYPE1|nr:uncharacterized protein HMPREF1541_05491 [Cyphellophora europaea CBS 101466]ETN39268.1 hypothetical protein HMPREF1541_05491 [Cyphellophora europaea CBS 101466]